jgi:hypothetical protein
MQYSQSHSFFRRRIDGRSDRRSFWACTILAFFVFLPSFSQTPSDRLSAERKVRLIEANRWPATRTISFTPSELLALGMSSAESVAPGSISKPALQLKQAGAVVSAMIDFDRLRSSQPSGNSMSDWLTARLVTGQHLVSVSAGIVSANGRMTIHPESVTVSGVTVSGNALRLLIEEFILPRYPDAVVDRPFSLASNIKEIAVTPASAWVFAK